MANRNGTAASRKTSRKRMPREYGIGDFLDWLHSEGGMRNAVRRVVYEDRQLKLFREMAADDQTVKQ